MVCHRLLIGRNIMDIYYSPSTPGFFSTVIFRKEQMPLDAVGITLEQHQALMLGESLGKTITLNDSGVPVLLEFVEPPVDTAAKEREWRDSALASVLWLRERHRDQLEIGEQTTLTAEQFAALLVYMQVLRDWPQSPDFPSAEHRPAAPAWIAEQTQ